METVQDKWRSPLSLCKAKHDEEGYDSGPDRPILCHDQLLRPLLQELAQEKCQGLFCIGILQT